MHSEHILYANGHKTNWTRSLNQRREKGCNLGPYNVLSHI